MDFWTMTVNCCNHNVNYVHLCFLQMETRSAWQSPTWGRPVPQVRVENKFR